MELSLIFVTGLICFLLVIFAVALTAIEFKNSVTKK
jgi:hypothetical protein